MGAGWHLDARCDPAAQEVTPWACRRIRPGPACCLQAACSHIDMGDLAKCSLPSNRPAPACPQMAYNMVYSLGQHSYDGDCNLFLRIFSGDVEEAVRQDQAALEEQVGWGRADRSVGGEVILRAAHRRE